MKIKSIFLLLISLWANSICIAQTEVKLNIKNLQGYWVFTESDFSDYILFKDNRKLEISYFINSDEVEIDGNQFGYFGFWDSEQHNEEQPKKLSQLQYSGKVIVFYDEKNINYDSDGNLLKKTRQSYVTLNEDSDEPTPSVLRFYYKGTPDVYTKIRQIPNDVLIALKKKPHYWKTYTAFVEMVQKPINVTKATIFKSPMANQPTKMYLIKGDIVEVLRQEKGWVKIRYYGTSVVEGWLKSSDLDN